MSNVIEPALLLFCCGVSAAFLICAIRRHQGVQIAVSSLAVLVASYAFWRNMDMNPLFPAAMLAFCCGVCGIVGGLAVGEMSRRERLLRSLPAAIGTALCCGVCLLFLMPFRMWDETVMEARSPDGAYKATLYYRDGLTFGYQRVVMATTGWQLFDNRNQVVEMVNEGVTDIRWQGKRTLVVEYDGTKPTGGGECPEFASQDRRWRDVQIVYRAVQP